MTKLLWDHGFWLSSSLLFVDQVGSRFHWLVVYSGQVLMLISLFTTTLCSCVVPPYHLLNYVISLPKDYTEILFIIWSMKTLGIKVKVKIKIKGPTMCTHGKVGVIANMFACASAGVHTHKVIKLAAVLCNNKPFPAWSGREKTRWLSYCLVRNDKNFKCKSAFWNSM